MRDVLPSLKPIFTVKEPVQAVVGLLDNLAVFKDKCTDVVFREGKRDSLDLADTNRLKLMFPDGRYSEVMPLVYHALESENPVVLEKALKVVPGLCETLDYTVSPFEDSLPLSIVD